MQNRPDLYVPLIYLLAAIPYALLGLSAWRRRPAVAVTPFAWTMLGMSVWSFTYGVEVFFTSLPAKILVAKIEYFGIVSIPICILFFTLEFIGKSHLLNKRVRWLLWLFPLLILLLVWTNDYHGLMWSGETLESTSGLLLLDIQYGPFFLIHIIFTGIIVLVSSILLIMEMVQRPGVYRIHISLIVLGILLPWFGSLIFVGKISPVPNLDVTPLFFLPTGLGLSWAITRYRLLEILPLEHLNVLKNMKDGVIVINSSQRVLYINPVTEMLFNRTETNAIGQPLVFVSRVYQEQLAPYLTGGEQRAEIMIGEGNQAKVFEATVSPVSSLQAMPTSIGPDSIITLHDITQRKESENALSRRELIMSAIGLAADQFLKESTWEHNIPGVLEKIGQAADVSRVYVFMNYSDAKGTIFTSQCYEWSAAGVLPQINNPRLQHIPLREAGFQRWIDRLSRGDSIHGILDEFPQSEQDVLKDQGILSMAILPIFVDNRWWGFIGIDECKYERHWTGTELEALHIAANIFGSAETRARTEQKLIRRQRTLNLMHEIVLVSLQSEDLLSMSQTLVDRLGELINASGCFLSLWNENNQQTIPLAAYGPYKETYRSVAVPPGERTFTQSVLKIRQTLIIEDTSNSPFIEQYIAQKFTSRSVLVLPLIAGKKKLGAVMLSFDQTHHFQPDEISICEQAAGLIALALEKFQAMEQAQRRANASEKLRKASAAITETLETKDAVTRILEQLNEVIPYDSASVQLLEGDKLEIVGGRGWENSDDVIGISFTVPGDNPNSVVLESGRSYNLPEAWKVYEQFNYPPHDHIRSWLGVPLTIQNKIIGLLAIDSTEANHFTEEDANLASTFADQVAVVLENARIFKETQGQAITDSLTGIYNRRGLFQIGEFEFLRARRIERAFCALMLDIDRFKRINDHYGHATGDQALRGLADRCRNSSRAVDLICRYGGEEFVILLPETHIEAAKLVAERLRLSIMENPMTTDSGPLRITVSIGIAEANGSDTLKSLIERADEALYDAKHAGRNCVRARDVIQTDSQT